MDSSAAATESWWTAEFMRITRTSHLCTKYDFVAHTIVGHHSSIRCCYLRRRYALFGSEHFCVPIQKCVHARRFICHRTPYASHSRSKSIPIRSDTTMFDCIHSLFFLSLSLALFLIRIPHRIFRGYEHVRCQNTLQYSFIPTIFPFNKWTVHNVHELNCNRNRIFRYTNSSISHRFTTYLVHLLLLFVTRFSFLHRDARHIRPSPRASHNLDNECTRNWMDFRWSLFSSSAKNKIFSALWCHEQYCAKREKNFKIYSKAQTME